MARVADNFDRGDQSPLTTSSSGHTWTRSIGSFDIGVINKKSKMTQGYILVDNYATPQLAANAASGKRLIFPVNKIYTVTDLLIPANCYVEGNGSTLKYANNSTTSSSHSDRLLKVNGSGVTVDGLKFDGNSQNQTIWSQHRHSVGIEGTFNNVEVKNCTMDNIIGDGVYIRTQTGSNILVHGNTFTANNDNRNGVSVTAGTNVKIYQNIFNYMTRGDMPGSVDIEPNFDTDVCTGIWVYENTLIHGDVPGTGTESGIIAYLVNNADVDDVRIYSNDITGQRLNSAVTIAGIDGGPFNSATNIDIYDNNIHGINPTGICVELDWWIGADVYDNIFSDAAYGIYNYKACLGTSTGNVYNNIGTQIQTDDPHCS